MGWSKRKESEVSEVEIAPETDRLEEVEQPSPPSTIGPDIEVRGDVTGRGDVLVQGRVEGRISLPGHRLMIAATGVVTAEVQAGSVLVEGRLVGNVTAEHRVEIAPGGSVEGDLAAARVVLSDGSRFRGRVDMAAAADVADHARAVNVDADAEADVDDVPAPAFEDANDDALSFLTGS